MTTFLSSGYRAAVFFGIAGCVVFCHIALLSAGDANPTSFELLQDPGFARGFTVLAPKAGDPDLGQIGWADTREAPAWQVAQWHSRFPFSRASCPPHETLSVSNVARWLRLEPAPTGAATLTLGVDSRPEYSQGARRSAAEPWVHLLVQQAIHRAPPLARTESLRLRFEFRLAAAETFRGDGYSTGMHAAQFQVVLTLNNTREGSPGFGDYLWFVVPVYDDRYDLPPAYVAQDFAVTHGKLIFNPGAEALGFAPIRAGSWERVDCELRPWLEKALEAAWAKGYLKDSRERNDYRLAHINLGWEVPGVNRVAMEIRDLSLRATKTE